MRTVSLLLTALLISACGCAGTSPWTGGRWWAGNTMYVEADSHGTAVELSADEVVLAMRRAGFEDEEILELGPKLRNSLALSGGARVLSDEAAEAIFAADAEKLYVSSRQQGTFSLPLEPAGWARANSTPRRPVEQARHLQPVGWK